MYPVHKVELNNEIVNKNKYRGAWVAQLVKHPILDFGSGHDLMVHELEPHIEFSTDSLEPAWESLSPSLSAPPPHVLSLSQKKSTLKKR